jgi:hypothetical protein
LRKLIPSPREDDAADEAAVPGICRHAVALAPMR